MEVFIRGLLTPSILVLALPIIPFAEESRLNSAVGFRKRFWYGRKKVDI